MAGIGIRLQKIYSKNTIITNLVGFGYSCVVTIAPMLIIIAVIILMQELLGFSRLDYTSRELYSCTILYIFIFSLMTAAPFNAVISRYLSDVIYEEKYDDIVPCFYTGLLINVVFSSIPGIAFCVHEYTVGKVDIWYVFAGYAGYMALMFAFYVMLYLSICKDYKKISMFFAIGAVIALFLSLIFHYVFKIDCGRAMLYALVIGVFIIAMLEFSLFRGYFKENSGNYAGVLAYFKKYWQLVVANFFYIVGLYAHNFVFWTTDMRMVVVKSFVCVQPYDMASCIAMFTNISSSVIFLTRVEMFFHERYKKYSESVIGGRRIDINRAKGRMFRQLMEEVMTLTRVQFIISTVVFLLAMILLPRFGFGGQTMKIYPCLAVGYFIMFIMYAIIIFLYYFNDLTGAALTSTVFLAVTVGVSFIATHLPIIWYGIGLVAGATAGFIVAYLRIRTMERTIDIHVFCNGSILKRGKGSMPSNCVYSRGKNRYGTE